MKKTKQDPQSAFRREVLKAFRDEMAGYNAFKPICDKLAFPLKDMAERTEAHARETIADQKAGSREFIAFRTHPLPYKRLFRFLAYEKYFRNTGGDILSPLEPESDVRQGYHGDPSHFLMGEANGLQNTFRLVVVSNRGPHPRTYMNEYNYDGKPEAGQNFPVPLETLYEGDLDEFKGRWASGVKDTHVAIARWMAERMHPDWLEFMEKNFGHLTAE